MNALRKAHLEGRRLENSVCGNCGQLTHCLPDNIDEFRDSLLPKFLKYMKDAPQIIVDKNATMN